jgi:predicted ABC-type ATPase
VAKPDPPRVWVLAGVNGAGKSSVGGAAIRSFGGAYFNPDEAARRLMTVNPRLGQTDANGLAWRQGRRLLERAIAERRDFAFETTLGGNTITRLLAEAARARSEVHVWYAGLASAEQHLARIRARVRRGGHDIPEADVRRRYRHSRLNLVYLLPLLTSLRVYNNSVEADPADGHRPAPTLVLELRRGLILNRGDLAGAPEWAKPIVAAALKLPSPPVRRQERSPPTRRQER